MKFRLTTRKSNSLSHNSREKELTPVLTKRNQRQSQSTWEPQSLRTRQPKEPLTTRKETHAHKDGTSIKRSFSIRFLATLVVAAYERPRRLDVVVVAPCHATFSNSPTAQNCTGLVWSTGEEWPNECDCALEETRSIRFDAICH